MEIENATQEKVELTEGLFLNFVFYCYIFYAHICTFFAV